MKKLKVFCLIGLMLLGLTACGKDTSETSEEVSSGDGTMQMDDHASGDVSADAQEIQVTLGVPKAPPTLPVLRMMDAGMLGDDVTLELDVWDSPEQLIAMVQDGEHDMFAFPLTVVSKLYNKGLDIRLTNVNTWGVTYFVTTDESLTDWSQLKGKTVYVPLQSSPPDALTQFFLEEAGLTVGEDVEIVYSTTTEISQMLAAGTIEYATLIEPQVTAAMQKNENVRIAFSFEEEWKKIKGDDSIVPNAGFGTTERFISENPELVEQFEEAYEEALNWVLENPQEAGELAEEYLGLNAQLVEQAIPNMGLTYKSAQDARCDLDGFYQLLLDFNPEMIGGSIPDETMYYGK